MLRPKVYNVDVFNSIPKQTKCLKNLNIIYYCCLKKEVTEQFKKKGEKLSHPVCDYEVGKVTIYDIC